MGWNDVGRVLQQMYTAAMLYTASWAVAGGVSWGQAGALMNGGTVKRVERGVVGGTEERYGAEIWVSLQGKDSAAGTKEEPLRTIEAAS